MDMLTKVYNTPGIAAIELNLACPNIPGKPMIAYDYDQFDQALARVCKHPQFGKIPLGLKLAPYFDMPHFDRVAEICCKYPIKFIVCVNSIPNGLFIDADNECEGFVPKSGLGGIGGGFCKHTALANVRHFYKLLQKNNRPDIDVIGVGGISTGRDAFEYILCGAKAVQVGTCHWTEGPGCFDRIAKELEDLMKSKGYRSIEDFRGKLKPYVKGSKKASEAKDEETTVVKSKGTDPLVVVLSMVVAGLIALVAVLHQRLPAEGKLF